MNKFLCAALVVLVAGALIWGFSVVGGPAYARMEKNDRTRLLDLRELASYYRCEDVVEKIGGGDVTRNYCASGSGTLPDDKDPVTGTAYRYVKTGDTAFEICATFELATDIDSVPFSNNGNVRGFVFEGHEGCLGYERDKKGECWRVR